MKEVKEIYYSPSTTHTMLGALLHRMNRPEEAINEYQRAIELDPECVEAYLNWGMLLEDSGRVSEAKEKYQRALRIDPQNPVLKAYLASIQPSLS